MNKRSEFEAGMSLIELMVAMAIGMVLMVGIVRFLQQGLDVTSMVMQRGEMQQSARAALNIMARDLSIAGTGIPPGGIQLPTATGTRPRFGCDTTNTCYTLPNNVYLNDRLYAINPWSAQGISINGLPTDMVTIAYVDDRVNLNALLVTSTNASGTQINIDPATNPSITDPAVGIIPGDIVMLSNNNGSAVGVVTSVPNNTRINTANLPDALRINQSAAGVVGNIRTILTPAAPISWARLMVITYYIATPAGLPPRLMRQVNAQPPAPIADAVRDLQLSYDIYDDNLAVATANQTDAGGAPNQIRKTTISITFRSPVRNPFRNSYEEVSLSTQVSARNLSFRDRYQ